jgi:hypothetical protein
MGQPDTYVPAKRGRKKKKHAGGRPPKFSPDIGVFICNLLRKGYSRKDACTEVGITYPTMYVWLKKGEAEKGLDESKRTGYFTFWDSVQDIESSKEGHYGVSKSSNRLDPRRPGIGDAPESCPTESDEQYQTEIFEKTILNNQFIIETPTEKQKKFLLKGSPRRGDLNAMQEPIEVFFHGAIGSGKTTGLIMAALQYAGYGGYQALLVRSDRQGLQNYLMNNVYKWLSDRGMRWNERKLTWKFPSGARLTFHYLHDREINPEEKNHKLSYEKYQFIGCDDLTSFTKAEYLKLISRLRSPAKSRIPIRICSTGNASGLYSDWVKEYFISHSPEYLAKYNRYTVSIGISDNPHLSQFSYIRKIKNANPLMYAQLYENNWDLENSDQ